MQPVRSWVDILQTITQMQSDRIWLEERTSGHWEYHQYQVHTHNNIVSMKFKSYNQCNAIACLHIF